MIRIYNKLIKPLFFSKRFYFAFTGVIFLFILAYPFPFFLVVAQLLLLAFVLLTASDYLFLFFKKDPLAANRIMADRFSNADNNMITIEATSTYAFGLEATIIDEVPVQFQQRDFKINTRLEPGMKRELVYYLRPLERGEYLFGRLNIFVRSPLNFTVRRLIFDIPDKVKVYPSFFILRQYSLNSHLGSSAESGNIKIRKLGQSLEFEQIREYVSGDDIRNINWNATAKRGGQLMLNSYTDERSQQVYCIIDKGRVMKMPFKGMTLLDYAINSSVILSHVALIKQDKAGLVTFSNNIDTYLQAGKKRGQMNNVLDTLYAQSTGYLESDFEKLHATIRTKITQRSLLLLFTNFESMSGLERQLPYLRKIAQSHLLLVVFFENTELKQITDKDATDVETIYMKTIAEKFAFEKKLIVKELHKYGILSILTPPENVTVNALNKYLELKARQAI